MKLTGKPETDASMGDLNFARLQLALPTRFLSWLIYLVTRIRQRSFKNLFIRQFMSLYRISLAENDRSQVEQYESFNDFFTRGLRPGARVLDPSPQALLSPVDGTVSQAGEIVGDRIFQAKGHEYSAQELLGGDAELAAPFEGGRFTTIYLAPNNYHRIHMPLTGTLRHWVYVPGRLFSVNPATVRAMPGVFARNERVCAVFDTDRGPFALVMVGALFVGSMETVWAGRVTPPHKRGAVEQFRPIHPVELRRGDEMGRFNMGSTVILLTPPGMVEWDRVMTPGNPLRMGQRIAKFRA
ncbi:phosphatidylserine decarboxylase [Solimonas sp. K1W22B-7]|uniref:archaetidylserine decarboxylase n=1 Tax=Solimonas sp. K1W22B-7 TaxID=2303331 RepID=UPI000E3372EE|nr:archaetidylserine decarboxylase [Solimonas sp. K1W22B-7]AXQ29487.1 phosphatidylserine decarboxylase [Solimonas sp. K1W22B-7]